MATQPDGKLLLVGTSRQQDGDFAMVRFERDGTLDASLGDDGVAPQHGAGPLRRERRAG